VLDRFRIFYLCRPDVFAVAELREHVLSDRELADGEYPLRHEKLSRLLVASEGDAHQWPAEYLGLGPPLEAPPLSRGLHGLGVYWVSAFGAGGRFFAHSATACGTGDNGH